MNGIDIHTHVVPESFPPYRGCSADVPWPLMRPTDCGHAQVLISGKVYRTVDESAWSPRKRAEEMSAMGIGRQVLSLMPELLSYWLPAADAAVLLRSMNEQIAAMVQADPRRFSGLGAVPLQDIDLAIRELEHAVRQLGLCGVEIGSSVNGVTIGDARFKPFFLAAERLGAAVFVHALRPATERLVGPPVLEQVIGYPCDVALAIASMITGGTLRDVPGLRIAFSHGGGAFALLLARMEHTAPRVPQLKALFAESPASYARRLYYDSNVFSPSTLRFLIESFGEDRLMIGTDYPFGSYERDPIGLLRRADLSESAFAALKGGNARRYLALEEEVTA